MTHPLKLTNGSAQRLAWMLQQHEHLKTISSLILASQLLEKLEDWQVPKEVLDEYAKKNLTPHEAWLKEEFKTLELSEKERDLLKTLSEALVGKHEVGPFILSIVTQLGYEA